MEGGCGWPLGLAGGSRESSGEDGAARLPGSGTSGRDSSAVSWDGEMPQERWGIFVDLGRKWEERERAHVFFLPSGLGPSRPAGVSSPGLVRLVGPCRGTQHRAEGRKAA